MSLSTAKSAGAFPSIRPGTISTVGSRSKPPAQAGRVEGKTYGGAVKAMK
jgi:hypothetical protein